MTYRHTQVGWTMILTLGGGVAFLGREASRGSGVGSSVVLAVLGVLAICLVLFISPDALATVIRTASEASRRR